MQATNHAWCSDPDENAHIAELQIDGAGMVAVPIVVSAIEAGDVFYVSNGWAKVAQLEVVTTAQQRKYVRTIPDETTQNNLLSLPTV